MKILILFILSFSSLYSQNLEFEEVLDFDPSGISTAQNATLSLKGDSAFFHVELDTASPYVDYINNFYFSSDNGKTWENVTENFQKILFGDFEFLSGQFFHQKLFMFIHKFYEDDELFLGYFDVKGKLIEKIELNPEYRNWRIILNHINEDFIGLYGRYLHDTSHDRYIHYFDYSTDRGKTWHNVHPEHLPKNMEITFELNIRNPELGFFSFNNYQFKTPLNIFNPFKYNFYNKTYDYSYQRSPNGRKDYGFRDEDFIIDKYHSNIMPLLDLSISAIVDTISSYKVRNVSYDSLENLNNDNYIETVNLFGFFKYLENDYVDYNYSKFRFNLTKPDTFLCRLVHNSKEIVDTGTVINFSRSLIFSSYDGGLTFNLVTELSIRNIFLNPINDEIWSIFYQEDNRIRLFKSKKNLFSSVYINELKNITVYFSKNNLIIENNENASDCKIKILDLNGRVLYDNNFTLIKGTNQIPLSSQINPNLYLVNIEFKDSKVNIYKLIKGE